MVVFIGVFLVNRNGPIAMYKHTSKGVSREEYRCYLCNSLYNNIRNYRNHFVLFHGEERYNCVICGRFFDDLKKCEDHVKTVHKCVVFLIKKWEDFYFVFIFQVVMSRYYCRQCSYSHPNREVYQRHLYMVHREIIYYCSICSLFYQNVIELANHTHTTRNTFFQQ